MEETEIQKAKFEATEELSQIQMKLSDARVAFENLKKAEEEYLVFREGKVVDHLNTLEESLKDAFQEFNSNKKTFASLKEIISGTAEKTVNLTAEIQDTTKLMADKLDSLNDFVHIKMTKIREERNKLQADRLELNEDMERLNKQARDLANDQKVLADRKARFEERWAKLNTPEE